MAAEYGARLKWPKDKEQILLDNIGKPATITLKLEFALSMPDEVHTIDIVGGKEKAQQYFDEIYEKCYVHIMPVTHLFISGTILSYEPK